MDDSQLLRYSRQIMLPDFDIAGQEKLLAATVLIVGLGGLGCPAAMYLAAAGVGHLILADHDVVDLTNLQRQIAHTSDAIGEPKVRSAERTLLALNPGTRTTLVEERLSGQAMTDAVQAADLVIDASDNFDTRFALNKACFDARVPLVSGAAIQWEGQVTVLDPRDPGCPCYRCLYEESNDGMLNCAMNGVLSPVVGIIGTVQALEATKVLAGVGRTLAGYLLVLDARNLEWRKLKLPKNAACPVCGPHKPSNPAP